VPDGTPVIESIKGTPTSINKSSAFSADGKLVVIADSPTSMRFYDAATGAAVGPKMEHDLQIYSSAFSGDGKKLATVSTDQTARLWEVPSGKALLSPLEHEEPVSDVRFTSDGRHLVTSSSEGTTRVWDVATGRLAIEPLRRRFRDLAPNRGELMTFDGNMVRRWDAAPSAVAPTPFPSVAGRLRVQRDPKMQTAWALFSNQIQEMDVLNGRPLGAPRAFPVRTNQQFLLPGARHLGVITELGDTELWDLRSPNIVRHPLGRYKIRTLGFSSDSSHFAIAYDESHVQVWDTASGKPVGGPLKHESGANGIAFSPDRSLLAVACADYKAVVWELASGKRVGNLTMQQGTVVAVEFSPDGRLIATGCLGGTAQLWDAGTTQPVGPLHRLRGRVGTVAFSRDSRRLLTSALWETRVWDAATGAPLTDPMLQPYATKDPLVGAVFSEDETLIATYSRTGEVRIWDSASGLLVVEPIKFGKTIISLNFFSSDRFLTASHPLGGFSVWTIPPCAAGTRMPDWLMRLATALAGGEIDSRAIFRTRPFNVDVFEGIRKELAAAPLEGPFVEWGRWFLADRATRPVGPGLKITPAEAMALAGPDPLLAMKNRANVLKDEGNYAEAEPLFRQALAQEIVLHGESSMTVADRRAGLSQTLVALGKFEEAEELARASLKIRAQLLATPFGVASSRGVLGSALVGQKRYAEAEPVLVQACEAMRQQGDQMSKIGYYRSGVRDRVTSLVQLYEATGRPEKAEEWKKFLATLSDPAPPPPAPNQPE
jgi:WD40 repeat protein